MTESGWQWTQWRSTPGQKYGAPICRRSECPSPIRVFNERFLSWSQCWPTRDQWFPRLHIHYQILEGKSWKEAWIYKLNKLERWIPGQKSTGSDIPTSVQILTGHVGHTIVKDLESSDKKFRSRWVVRGHKQKKTNLSLSEHFHQYLA